MITFTTENSRQLCGALPFFELFSFVCKTKEDWVGEEDVDGEGDGVIETKIRDRGDRKIKKCRVKWKICMPASIGNADQICSIKNCTC